MATNKECKCITNAARVIMWASSLEEQGTIGQHFGDLRFKEPRTVMPGPKEINTLSGMIHRDATELKKDLEEFDKTCDISKVDKRLVNNYNEGKGVLDQVIKSEGIDMNAASYAGARINDTIQDMVTLKKLVSCKDWYGMKIIWQQYRHLKMQRNAIVW